MCTTTMPSSSTLPTLDPLYAQRQWLAVGFAVGLAILAQGMLWGVWLVAGATVIWVLASRVLQRRQAAAQLAEKKRSVVATDQVTSAPERRGASFA